MSSKTTRRWLGLIGATGIVACIAWIGWAGPVVVVDVTTTDAEGKVVPAVGDLVYVWTKRGMVSSPTDSEGKASFWMIKRRARWVPTLGPDSFPITTRQFFVELDPHEDKATSHCPRFFDDDVYQFVRWFWQRVEVRRPPHGLLSVSVEGTTESETYWVLMSLEDGSSWGARLADGESICVRANTETEVSLVLAPDSATVYTWPKLTPRPYEKASLHTSLVASRDDS